ncbi:hypothetical protein AMECASPLE_030017, partial [Ameca splendens]
MRDTSPTLSGITDIIATNIPSLAGVATGIRSSTHPASPALLSKESLADSISRAIPGLDEAANAVANPIPLSPAPSKPAATTSGSPSLESIMTSLSNMTSFAEFVSSIPNPSAPPLSPEPHPPLERIGSGGSSTDVGALSQLVKACLDPTAGVKFPPAEGAANSAEEIQSPSSLSTKEEDPYVTVLACWTNQEEAESESSNEEEDTGVCPAPTVSEQSVDENPGSHPVTPRVTFNQSEPLIPARPAPPPPNKKTKPVKQRTPRAATIRVSRKKGGSGGSAPQSAVVRASWLDVWKGF